MRHCKCRCESGSYDLGDDFIDDALTADEAAERLVLTCQMIPRSDCVIEVPVPSAASKVKPVEHWGTVHAVDRPSSSAFVLSIALDEPRALDFLPGQYVHLFVPGTDAHRAYSFSSKPGATEATFLIRNIPGGMMSGWLADRARPGDRVRMIGPQGSFFLREVARPLVMLAGGTGLAPILSMLEVLAERGTDRPIRLLYGVTADADLVETARIAALAARLPTLAFDFCVVDPASACPRKGYVTDHLDDADLHGGDCDVYLCGPPAMVEGVRRFLREKGITPAQFHYEKFAATELVPA